MSDLSGFRLIYIAPRTGASGVGDYADDFFAAVAPSFGDARQLRHGAPGTESVRDIRAARREIRRLVAEARSEGMRAVVHSEQSGGAMIPFWAPLGLTRMSGVTVTATVHDPPLAVWWPLRVRTVARSRVVMHGIHRPLFPAFNRLEARMSRGTTLFALTTLGAQSLERSMPGATVVVAALPVPERPSLREISDRPVAVGLFGYVYRGKGFDSLVALRETLPPEVAIRVAGRGTESLPVIDGVELLGEVNGPDEDAFFDSIRMLVVPYAGREIYGRTAVPASSTVTRAMAYQTPVLTRSSGALGELHDGVVVVGGDLDEFCGIAGELMRDDARLGDLQRETLAVRARESAKSVTSVFLRTWERLA